uniref:Phospholipid/glycerol acyltransferase domain-containing protein n=1 Tax=Kalanchoe fedtschenkoi TaxID=63787 RepID=A0A7N1A0N9_KALFE
MVNKALSRYFSFASRILLRQLRSNSSKYLHRKPSIVDSPFSKLHKHGSLTGSRSPFSRNTALMCSVEGGLLRSSSLFPYFMLVAFEGGSIVRALLLLALYPVMCVVRSENMRLKMMVMVCFLGIRKDGFRIGASVLPKFLLEDVGWEGFEVAKKKRFARRVGVSAMPRVMVESFVKDYMGFDGVIGSELKVFNGYFVGLVEGETPAVPLGEARMVVGIKSIDTSLDQHLMSTCDEIYVTSESERGSWKQLPRDKYPKPLIFHDGRLAFRPTPLASLAMFAWFPFGVLLALFRVVVGLCMPYNISIPTLGFSGLNLRFTSTAQESSHPKAKGILYVCNHRTLLDPLYLCFILKKNLTAVTYSLSRMSEILSPIRTIRLARDLNKDSSLMDHYLSQGDMVVCPEGTTCREPFLLRFSPLFTEMSGTIVPVAMNCDVNMFYGTTAGGLKCLDPIFFLMNPFPSYTVKFLDQISGLSYSTSHAFDLGGIGRDSRRFDIANQVQSELGKTLNFECTRLTRKAKYLVLAGNEGIVSPANK